MKRIQSALSLSALLVALAVMTGCDKNEPYDVITPPDGLHFTGAETQVYDVVVNPAPAFAINIGATTVSSSDRTVSVNITSSTGASSGAQYNIVGGNTVTVPAGEVIGNFAIQANYSAYTTGRIDTLTLALTNPTNTSVSDFLDTVKVIVRGPCFEGDIVLSDFLGTYANTNELFGTSAYGPYTTTVSGVASTSATTGTITVTNIFDFGWNPITFILDWTDPSNLIATLDEQSGIGDAGTINSAYAGLDVSVRASAGNPGTFSWCNGTLDLKMQPGVTGLGWFNLVYQVNMRR
ncbi:MAG: hypothetical protein ACK4E0_10315 [Chitinophagaceae bacterium]